MPSKDDDARGITAMIGSKIRVIPDYPKPGIMFRDITPLLKDSESFSMSIDALAEKISSYKADYIAGIEARGFIVGSALAYKLNKGFIPIRKKGKLPYDKIGIDYELEYGKETLEVHRDCVEKGSSVIIADDLLATGGTARASAELLGNLGARIAGYAFLIDLSDLHGRKRLGSRNIATLLTY